MLVINYNGKKPAQRNYEYCVVGNSDVDTIKFVLLSDFCGYPLEDVVSMNFDVYVKIQSAGKEYIDKIYVGNLRNENGVFFVNLFLTKKMTHWKNIALQLQFENDEGYTVAQTEIVSLTLSGNIPADETMDDEYPYAIQQVEGLAHKNERDIEELKAKGDTVILTDNPDEYENEYGLKKIIRKVENNGDVEKSYLINEKHYPNTLVVCEQHSTVNGYDYTGEVDDLVNDLGRANFEEIFGDNYSFDELFDVFSLFYNESGVITKGLCIGLGNNEEYGGIGLVDCIPNKEITIVVGKYFEYDEQGNKIFDEHSSLYSTQVVGSSAEYHEITEERQEFKLKIAYDGRLYFDSDGTELGFGNTRFILYEIKTGEPAHIEHSKNEIITKSQKFTLLPVFKMTQPFKDIVDYYKEHYGENECMSFAIECDYGLWGNDTCYCSISVGDDDYTEFYSTANGGYRVREGDLSGFIDKSIEMVFEDTDYFEFVLTNKQVDCSQEQYDNMSSHDTDATYFVYEDE